MSVTSQISVVIASFCGAPVLRRCLESVMPQARDAEVLVATADDSASAVGLEREFPGVRFLSAVPGTNVFRLRSLALSVAQAPIVVLTEDHCTAAPGWLAAIADAFADRHDVVGGSVENGLAGRRDWALFFCEYLALLPPLPDGPTRALLGVNAAYRRAALDRCSDVWRDEFHESEVHDALEQLGYRQHATSRARVTAHLHLPLAAALRHFYRGGRRFGRYRQSRAAPLQRALRVSASPLVPPLLLYRMARTLGRRQPARLPMLLRSLPYLLCFVGAWAAGETAGYLSAPTAGPGCLTRESANAAARRSAE